MKKVLSIFIAINSIINLTFAFNPDSLWIKTYGGIDRDDAVDIRQTYDGGYILAGGTYSCGAGSQDFWIIKTNCIGDTLWAKTFGGSGDDRAYSVHQTSDSSYIITGFTTDTSNYRDIWLIKTDGVGNLCWEKKYDRNFIDWGLSVQQTYDKGYILAGFTQDQSDTDIWLIKTNAVGDTVWTKTYGKNYDDWAGCVQQTSDSGYIVTGFTEPFADGNRDVWLIKTDSSGDTSWTRKFGGMQEDWGRVVKQTQDGGYIIGAVTHSFGAGGSDIWLIKTNSSGDSVWSRLYGGIEDEWVYSSICQTLDGGFIVAGGTYSYGMGDADAWLIKTDSLANELWTKTYGGSGFDYASAVIQNVDGGYTLTGGTSSFGMGQSDAWIIKTDSLGNSGILTNVKRKTFQNPQTIRLFNNYPNPFNSTTTISFALPKASVVEIIIYNALGKKIKVINSPNMQAGNNYLTWNGKNDSGQPVSSGVYFYVFKAKVLGSSKETFSKSSKLLLLR
jgi:hypothetical protein